MPDDNTDYRAMYSRRYRKPKLGSKRKPSNLEKPRYVGGFIFDEHGNRRDYSSEPDIPRVRILSKSERGKR